MNKAIIPGATMEKLVPTSQEQQRVSVLILVHDAPSQVNSHGISQLVIFIFIMEPIKILCKWKSF